MSPETLEERTSFSTQTWSLKMDDKYYLWPEENSHHSFKIPVGFMGLKSLPFYKGLGHGQSFYFNEIDRHIYPLAGANESF